MSHAIIRNHETNGNEKDAERDGYYIRKPGGRLLISQTLLSAFVEAQTKLEKTHSLIQSALEQGGDVEEGLLNAGIFEEFKKSPNWRAEFIALGGDPKAVNARTPKKASYKTRVYDRGDKPDGTRVAPTADGKAWVKPGTETASDEGGEAQGETRKAAE
jgi:hypothetical protein